VELYVDGGVAQVCGRRTTAEVSTKCPPQATVSELGIAIADKKA